MAQSLSKILVHLVFSTKDRYPFLTPDIRAELHAYLATALRTCESPALIINSVADHVHILCNLARTRAACDVIEEVKKSTSKWLKTKGGILKKFFWQNGYGVFSVSPSNAESVRAYIERQELHHQRMAFEDELRMLLEKHRVEFDERYLWD